MTDNDIFLKVLTLALAKTATNELKKKNNHTIICLIQKKLLSLQHHI